MQYYYKVVINVFQTIACPIFFGGKTFRDSNTRITIKSTLPAFTGLAYKLVKKDGAGEKMIADHQPCCRRQNTSTTIEHASQPTHIKAAKRPN